MVDGDLTVVLPAFNEEARLPRTLDRLRTELGNHFRAWEIVVVDDGSVDRTLDVVKAVGALDPRCRSVRLDRNEGKGSALRHGALAAHHPLVVFLDADLPVPTSDLVAMAHLAADADLVVGSRRLSGSVMVTPQPLLRRLGGRGFILATRLLGYRSVSDPQCGVKLFRRDSVAPLFADVSTSRFGFDVELIERAERAGLRVVEHPVEWTHVEGSSLRPLRDALTTLADLARLRAAMRGDLKAAVRGRPSATGAAGVEAVVVTDPVAVTSSTSAEYSKIPPTPLLAAATSPRVTTDVESTSQAS